MEFLEGLPRGDNPSISSICEAVNCSLSTLERAFREHVGIGPKAYVIACRLHWVRRELLAADKPQRVGDVAIRWGFWHMEKFASDYCRAFGELPSATLNAPRTRGG